MSRQASAIVVTGASRGIGAAIAFDLARRGYQVGCLSRSGAAPALEATPEVAARWMPLVCDVTQSASVKAALDAIVSRGFGIAGLVNNAGFHVRARSDEVPLDEFRQVMETNAVAVLGACQIAYPHLLANGGGLIVNIGSFFDKMGVQGNAAYCASKAAVAAITRVLAVEWAARGIRVITVAPGYIVTDLNLSVMTEGPLADYLEKRIPGGKPGTASDVAVFVSSLFETGGSFLTGETIYIDGAQSIAH